MKSLKKTLCLVLVFAMCFTLMGFASAAEFTDESDINNTQAVQTNVALNIINGRDNGSFDPTGIVTRGEMCKMITVALNGGVAPTLGTKATPSYTDIKGSWAESYIEYCTNLGIISGMGDGTFQPDTTVTGSQAAKMLLVALGYKADYEGFTGTNWETNVNTIAMQKGLYDDIAIDPTAGLTRDNAAQMVYNALYAEMVKYSYGIAPGTGSSVTGVATAYDTGETMLTKCYKLSETSNTMTKIGYSTEKKSYIYTVDGTSFYSTEDFSALFGLKVKVLWKNKNATTTAYTATEDTVYDIIPDTGSVIATGTNGYLGEYNKTDNTLVFGTTTYKCDSTVTSIKNYDGTAGANLSRDAGTTYGEIAGIGGTYNVSLLDVDGNGKIDQVVAIPFTVDVVTYAGASSTTFKLNGNKANDDVVLYDGIAKDDVVAVYASNCSIKGAITAVKQTILTGTVTGTKTGAFKVNGIWMSCGDPDDALHANFTLAPTTPNNGDTIAYVAVGAYAPFVKVTGVGETSKDILSVYAAATPKDSYNSYSLSAKVILATGTKKTVTVSKVGGTEITSDVAYGYTTSSLLGRAYTYIVDSDGNYELTAVTNTSNKAGYDLIKDYSNYSFNGATDSIAGYDLADDATVLVVVPSSTAKAYTGKEIKNNISGTFGTAATVMVKKVNGFDYAEFAVITCDDLPSLIKGSSYGYLTEDAYTTYDSGTTYTNFVMWTTAGSVTYKEKKAETLSYFTKGHVISFDATTTDGVIKNVAQAGITTSYVTGYDDAKKVGIAGGSYKLTDDSVVLYVDSSATKGITDGGITEATPTGATTYDCNVSYIADGSNNLLLLVVDVDNDMEAKGGAFNYVGNIAAGDAEDLLDIYTTLNVTGNVTGSLDIDTGDTITVSGTIDTIESNDGTINANGNITTVTANSGTINVKDDLTIATLTANTGTISVAAAKTLTITNQATAPALKNILGAADTSKLVLSAASTASYVQTTHQIFAGSDGEYSANAALKIDTYTYNTTTYTWTGLLAKA